MKYQFLLINEQLFMSKQKKSLLNLIESVLLFFIIRHHDIHFFKYRIFEKPLHKS